MTEASGASSTTYNRVPPYAAARLYAEGQMSRVPGSFDEVQAACGEGLIDAPIRETALGALRAQLLVAPQTSRPIPGPACSDEWRKKANKKAPSQ